MAPVSWGFLFSIGAWHLAKEQPHLGAADVLRKFRYVNISRRLEGAIPPPARRLAVFQGATSSWEMPAIS